MKLSFIKKIPVLLLLAAWIGLQGVASAQVKLTPDTLDCHVVAFNFGMMQPLSGSNSEGVPMGSMKELYLYPSLDFGLEWDYKFASGWLLSVMGDLWFGMNSNNLNQRELRYDHIFRANGIAYAWNGTNGNVAAYNRGLALRPGINYIWRVLKNNPNSGILLGVQAGPFSQRTIFNQSYENSAMPQLKDDYAKLYDHKRVGAMLTQSVGFLFMSNYSTYANFRIQVELTECWSWSARAYQIDHLMGLNGKDNARYFDLLWGLRLTWMFPFTGKTAYDYYYY